MFEILLCVLVTGKKRAKSKAPEPVELSDKDETDAGCSQEIPAPMYRTTKKSSKSSKQERPGSNEKKESYKVSTNSVKSNKNRKNNKKEVSKTKKQTSKKQIELEQIDPSCDEQEHDPPPALEEQEEEQRTG